MLSQLSAPAFLCTNSVPSESTKAIVHADVQSEASRAYNIRFNTERPRDLGHVANVGPTADLLSSLCRSPTAGVVRYCFCPFGDIAHT